MVLLMVLVLMVAGCVQRDNYDEGNPHSDISETKLEGSAPSLPIENNSAVFASGTATSVVVFTDRMDGRF